jgi:hypothetical protein
LGAVFWTLNAALAIPLAWTSAYNQILCATFLLGAFHLLMRWAETGERRFLVWQMVVFILGFGALEHNVVYPALAAAWLVLSGRWRKLPWMIPPALISALYLYLHNLAAPKSARSGPYLLYTDPQSLWSTLVWYLEHASGGVRLQGLLVPGWLKVAGAASVTVLGVALAGFIVWRLSRRDWTVLFPIAWFVILIAPVLPLRDHRSHYYLTLPLIGFAMLGGWSAAAAWRAGWLGRGMAGLLSLWYLTTTIPVGHEVVSYYHEHSLRVRNLVLGVQYAHSLHPDKIILLNGVDSDLFWFGVNDKPFWLAGVQNVFLTPGSENTIQRHPQLGDPTNHVLPALQTLRAIDASGVVVYAAGGSQLRNITAMYTNLARSRLRPVPAQRIDVGHPVFADQLGVGWYDADNGFRWMGQKATVRLGLPESGRGTVVIEGYCPDTQLTQGAVVATLLVADKVISSKEIASVGGFRMEAPLPHLDKNLTEVEIEIGVNRTIRPPGDGRELGLAFGTFAIR